MPKTKKEPATFFCPDCGSADVYGREESLYNLNDGTLFCVNVRAHDGDAKAQCFSCDWKGMKQELIDKSEEIEAAEKLKKDKKFQQYLKLKKEFEPDQPNT